MQVLWFQCITDAYRYYYREKLDYNYWPIRTTNSNGLLEPLAQVFDYSIGYDQLLWTYGKKQDGCLYVRPKRVWPEGYENGST